MCFVCVCVERETDREGQGSLGKALVLVRQQVYVMSQWQITGHIQPNQTLGQVSAVSLGIMHKEFSPNIMWNMFRGNLD